MNAGCFEKEFKDILLSIQFVNTNGVVLSYPLMKLILNTGDQNLTKLDFFKRYIERFKTDKLIIEKEIYNLTSKKKISQPSKN